MGRYLDLYIPHTQFVNLKSARRYARHFAIPVCGPNAEVYRRRLTYMQYLNMLSKGLVGEAIDQKEKESAAYLECVFVRSLT